MRIRYVTKYPDPDVTLAATAIQITCYDRNGDIVKRVTSADAGTVEDNEDENSNTPSGGQNPDSTTGDGDSQSNTGQNQGGSSEGGSSQGSGSTSGGDDGDGGDDYNPIDSGN